MRSAGSFWSLCNASASAAPSRSGTNSMSTGIVTCRNLPNRVERVQQAFLLAETTRKQDHERLAHCRFSAAPRGAIAPSGKAMR